MKAGLAARATVVDRSSGADVAAQPVPIAEAVPQAEQVQTPQATAKPRRPGKVPLEKGYSQMEWMQLSRRHPDLAGLKGAPPRRGITMEEVKQHRSRDDAWLAVNGKVYNVTPYLKFHPGGVDYLMLGAGKDATALFNKYHRWVNIDMMMSSCLVGLLAPRRPAAEQAAAQAASQANAQPQTGGQKASEDQ